MLVTHAVSDTMPLFHDQYWQCLHILDSPLYQIAGMNLSINVVCSSPTITTRRVHFKLSMEGIIRCGNLQYSSLVQEHRKCVYDKIPQHYLRTS